MAKFIYRMQNILNIKLRLETQAKTEYAENAARLAAEEEKMHHLASRRQQYENEAKQSAMNRVNIASIKQSNESMSEAQAMYNCIVEAGISPDRLYIEDKAVNTGENIAFSEEIIKANGLNENKAIVTDGFHQLRAQIITKQQGLSGSVGSVNADTFPVFIPTFAVREWFALPNQVLFR